MTTSDIKIENFNNNSTEYTFDVVLSSGNKTDKICVAVDYDSLEETYYVEDMTGNFKRKGYSNQFDANYKAIELIRKYKSIYN